MKQTTDRLLIRASGLCAAMALAPLAGAQTSPSGAPPAPAALGVPAATAPPPAPSSAPADVKDQVGYLFGLTFGEQMHSVGISDQVDPDTIARGIKDGLAGKKSNRTDQQQIQAFVQSTRASLLAHNKQAAKDFLDKNGKEKGVKTTADGLEYKVLVPGDAKAAAIQVTDEVTVQYRGKLIDGTEFDSSYSRGVPATFKVGGVIKGWQEALQLMKPGSKYQLFIPPELAYDDQPKPGIPPVSVLIFDVEVVSVKAGTPPAGLASPVPPQSNKAVAPPLKPANPAQ
jgi:FKBP-type peptidyl-prolyl cis-trans isomerase